MKAFAAAVDVNEHKEDTDVHGVEGDDDQLMEDPMILFSYSLYPSQINCSFFRAWICHQWIVMWAHNPLELLLFILKDKAKILM